MGEPSKKDLREVFQRAYLARSEQGDPEATFFSDCSDAGYRALYSAGKADAEARIRAEERERVLARFAELADEMVSIAEEHRLAREAAKGDATASATYAGAPVAYIGAARKLRTAIEEARKA